MIITLKCPYCKQAQLKNKPHVDYEGLEHCSDCGENYRVKYENNIVVYVEKRGMEIEIPETLSQNVVDNFEEALACSRVEAYKATVAMCRRGLESLVDELGANGNTLEEKLEDFKNSGMIMDATYHSASGIRQFGNYGAHPQDDMLKDIDRNEAQMVLNIVERILMEIERHGSI